MEVWGGIVEVVDAIDVDDDGVDVAVVDEATEHVVVLPEPVATLVERPLSRISTAPVVIATATKSVPTTTTVRILTRALHRRGRSANESCQPPARSPAIVAHGDASS